MVDANMHGTREKTLEDAEEVSIVQGTREEK